MKKLLFKKQNKTLGFTLIELLVVIAIIAILTAIVTSNFATSKAKSRDAKRISDLAQIQLALALYFDKCNDYPGTLTKDSYSQNCAYGSSNPIPLSNYISVIPTDPFSTVTTPIPYPYKVNGSAFGNLSTVYVLHATLEQANTSVQKDALKTIPPNWAISAPPTCGGTLDYCVAPI